jgi:exodeoxyribonuclease VII large subunit
VAERLAPAVNGALARPRAKLVLAAALLDARDPTKILERGYAIVTAGGVIVRDAASLAAGSSITAHLARGSVEARVEAVVDDDGE